MAQPVSMKFGVLDCPLGSSSVLEKIDIQTHLLPNNGRKTPWWVLHAKRYGS